MKRIAFIAASLFALASAPSVAGTSTLVEYGTVQEVRVVTLDDAANGGSRTLRTVGAAALGAAVGNQFGGGSGKSIATATGAIAGAEASRRRQSNQSSQLELLVRTQNGKLLSVVQEHDTNLSFNKGDRVRILTSGADTSVDKTL